MKKQIDLWRELPTILDLPGESMPGGFLAELHNGNRILVEGVMGISKYNCNCIVVEIKTGQLCICGRELNMARMVGHQLVIRGLIDSITVLRRC